MMQARYDRCFQILFFSCFRYHHSAIVTTNGSLFVFGDSEGGRLGLGEDVAEKAEPVEVPTIVTEGLENEEVKNICANGFLSYKTLFR